MKCSVPLWRGTGQGAPSYNCLPQKVSNCQSTYVHSASPEQPVILFCPRRRTRTSIHLDVKAIAMTMVIYQTPFLLVFQKNDKDYKVDLRSKSSKKVVILLCGIKTLEQLWGFFSILWFCSSFVIILSCWVASVVSLSLIVFGCPSLSCCNWLSFMSLVVLGCHCFPWFNMVVLLFLVVFGVLCLWLSLVFLSPLVVFDVYGCLWLYLFVLGCLLWFVRVL